LFGYSQANASAHATSKNYCFCCVFLAAQDLPFPDGELVSKEYRENSGHISQDNQQLNDVLD
jgi:hypothetical protein